MSILSRVLLLLGLLGGVSCTAHKDGPSYLYEKDLHAWETMLATRQRWSNALSPAEGFEPFLGWHAPSTEQQAQLQLARKQIIFLHIAKTGGRTVEAFIEAAAGTDGLQVCTFMGSDLDPRSFEMVGIAPDFKLTGKLDHVEKGCDVLTGEWGMEAVIHPWVAPKVHASLTILRDPALRAISQINHLMQHGNNGRTRRGVSGYHAHV